MRVRVNPLQADGAKTGSVIGAYAFLSGFFPISGWMP